MVWEKTMKITELLSEVSPHDFDSDVDYYAALNKVGKPKHHAPKPERPMSDQDIEGEIAHKRGQQAAASRETVKTNWHDKEGKAPNGAEYNSAATFVGSDEAQVKHQMRGTVDHNYGAKKAVYQHVANKPDGQVHGIIYFVDNHKYGMWKPWKDVVAETATAGATSAGNIATVDAPQLSPGKARGKKSYTGSPGQSGTKAPPQPKVVQPKSSNGTAKNALDMKGANLFGSGAVKRS
jgi:hypothetical protein